MGGKRKKIKKSEKFMRKKELRCHDIHQLLLKPFQRNDNTTQGTFQALN